MVTSNSCTGDVQQKRLGARAATNSNIAFVWDNFGPIHADRCEAVAEHYRGQIRVLGIEVFGKSRTYSWMPVPGAGFEKLTLFPCDGTTIDNVLVKGWRIVRACLANKVSYVFMCHYERMEIFFSAVILRLFGCRVYVMNDSKYDDYRRYLWLEVAKAVLHIPYNGGIGAGRRSRDYMRFLGMRESNLQTGYNSMTIARLTSLAAADLAPGIYPFSKRHFSIVARLVLKKNISTAIAAYAKYRQLATNKIPLHIYGDGELEPELRAQVEALRLSEHILFCGFLQTNGIISALGSSLALILPSTEEQFGNVVSEAMAMGVPAIVSSNCGACDVLVNTGVNGFVVEPDNVDGFAFFMKLMADDEILWRKMSAASTLAAERVDTSVFVKSVAFFVDESK